jgi:ribonuclease VapC
MIVDSSAIIAIVGNEPERAEFVELLRASPSNRMSAASYLETSIVVDGRQNPVVSRKLDVVLDSLHIEIADVTAHQARVARAAYRDFGRGSGHPARLNLGDAFAYALAVAADEPLLFKGGDFVHTDVRPARA